MDFTSSIYTVTMVTDTTTASSIVTSDGHHLHTNSTPVSTDVTSSITESISYPSSTGSSGIGDTSQGNSFLYAMHICIIYAAYMYIHYHVHTHRVSKAICTVSAYICLTGLFTCVFMDFTSSIYTATTATDTVTTSSIVTSDDHHLQTNSTPVSTDVTSNITESISYPSSTGSSGIGDTSQGTFVHMYCMCTYKYLAHTYVVHITIIASYSGISPMKVRRSLTTIKQNPYIIG